MSALPYWQAVTNIDLVNKEMVRVQYKFEENFINPSPFTNVILAAFTTAHARLKLYSYLEKLQEQILYPNTDSVIFKYSPGILSCAVTHSPVT